MRFESIASPANSYEVALRAEPAEDLPRLVWRTVEHGKPVEYETEPAGSAWQRLDVDLLSLLPLDREL